MATIIHETVQLVSLHHRTCLILIQMQRVFLQQLFFADRGVELWLKRSLLLEVKKLHTYSRVKKRWDGSSPTRQLYEVLVVNVSVMLKANLWVCCLEAENTRVILNLYSHIVMYLHEDLKLI